MNIHTVGQLFLCQLGKLLSAEQCFLQIIQQMHHDCSDPSLCQLLKEHDLETQKRIARLEALICTPNQMACDEGAVAMLQEYGSMAPTIVQAAVADLFRVSLLGRMVHYKICSYSHLIKISRTLELNETLASLCANLNAEIFMGHSLINLAMPLSYQATTAQDILCRITNSRSLTLIDTSPKPLVG